MKRHSFSFACLALSFLIMAFLPVSAQSKSKGGSLTGTLTVTAPPRNTYAAKSNQSTTDEYGNPTYNSKPNPVSTKASHVLPEEVVVYLEKVPGTYKAPKKHVALDQKYLEFTHRVLAVLKGTTVDFTNNDPVYHNVFTNSQINKFDLGEKQKGQTASVKMKKVEVPVKVYCEVHSAMKSNILVLQNPFFATVTPGGAFKITGIPPGTYNLIAWHDYWEPVNQSVTIRSGKTTQADVTLAKVRN